MGTKNVDPTYGAAVPGDSLLTQHFTDVGDGTGTHNMNGVYTTGFDDGVFFIAPPVTEVYYLMDMHVFIEDTAITAEQYGGVTVADGILLQVLRGTTVIHDLLMGEEITSIAGWVHLGHDATIYEFAAGNEFMAVASNFNTSYGGPLVLDGSKGESIRFTCQDDLSGLVEHEAHVQGRKATIRTRT